MTSLAGRLTAVVAALAVSVTVGGALVGLRALDIGSLGAGAVPSLAWLAGAVGVVALAQLARLRVRVGAGAVQLAWGEAAIIILCAALPPVWVPLAVFAGVVLAQLILAAFTNWRGWTHVGFSAAALTLAGTAAAVVAWAIGPTYQVSRLSPSFVLALCAAGLAYAVVGALLVVTRIALQTGAGILRSFVEAFSSKLLMLFGNLAVGLLVVLFCHYDRRFLLLLPPIVWLLHQTYAYKLRGDDERRTWQAFAEATGALNRLDERDAVTAGIRGALRLFRAADVEVVIAGADGRTRRYVDRSQEFRGGGDVQPVDEEAAVGWADAQVDTPADPERPDRRKRGAKQRPMTVRKLMVGQVHVGELRLRLPGNAEMVARDRLMFAAYGDALAAAVHDAVTHDELLALSERNTYDAVHDPLTGLANRAALMTRGNLLLRRQPPGAPAALLLLDIDRFKEVNNTLGHPVGDELLRVLGTRLEAATRGGELLARLGGDEFALLAPVPSALGSAPVDPDIDTVELNGERPAAVEYAVGRARQLAELLAAPTEVSGVLLSVEASVGVVVAPAGEVDLPELLRRADIAMYQAKRGGPSIAWYQPSRDEASTDKLALLAELREALAGREQLSLLVQPAISLASGVAIGVEALVRWQHPRRGLLGPDRFLAAVEHSELIGPFTRYILERALEITARWRAAGIDVPVAVNLSARALLDRRLPDDVERLLNRHRVPANRLVLEITESVVVSELPVIDEVLAGLRATGVQLAVDDFGTGFSSLTFLTRVQVDEIKIDKAFVGRMVDSPEAAAIVRTTVDLARQLDLRVVAEGVETAEQRNLLAALGCTAAQGYHFFPPMSADRAAAVLQEMRSQNVRHLRSEGTG